MRQPIVEEFLELVRIEVNSRRERAMADALCAKLRALGFSVLEDQCGAKIDGQAGSLVARLAGDPAIPALMFSAHMDRVANHGHIQPVIDGDFIRSDGSSILGADDVSGICAILDGVRRVLAEKAPHGDLEIVFSVAEEVGLLGARYLDYSLLKSKMAYVMDTGGPGGTIVNQAPTQYTINIRVEGKCSHAGIEPEKGLSAIKVAATALSRLREGRLSPHTTSNFGVFKAGEATNIVCDLAEIKGEARSTRPRELSDYLMEVKRVFELVAAEYGAGLSVDFELEYETFRVDEGEMVIQLAARALRDLGLEPRVISSGGGMDGNYFNQHGLKAVGLSPGYAKVHTPEEEQSIEQLIKCGELVAAIIKRAADLKQAE